MESAKSSVSSPSVCREVRTFVAVVFLAVDILTLAALNASSLTDAWNFAVLDLIDISY